MNDGFDVLLNKRLTNENGDPEPSYAATLGLKSIVSDALNPFYKWGTSLPNLSFA